MESKGEYLSQGEHELGRRRRTTSMAMESKGKQGESMWCSPGSTRVARRWLSSSRGGGSTAEAVVPEEEEGVNPVDAGAPGSNWWM